MSRLQGCISGVSNVRFQAVTGAAVIALCCAATTVSAQTWSAEKALWEMTDVTATPAVERLYPVKSYGPTGSPSNGNGSSSASELEFGDSEQGSLGCIVGGTLGTAGAALIGAENIINLIAGGIVPAANPVALYAAMGGVVFASFCAVGQAMTPMAMYLYRRYVAEPELPAPGTGGPMVNRPPAANSSIVSPSRFLKIAEPR
jgi:hypothetical protein